MNENEFKAHVVKGVEDTFSQYPHANEGDAFTHWASHLVMPNLDMDQVFDLVLQHSGPNDKGIDLSYRNEEEGIHFLFQAKYGKEIKRFGPATVRELFSGFDLLSKQTFDYGSTRIAELAEEIQSSIEHQFEIRFVYLLFGDFTEEAYSELRQREQQIPHCTVDVYNFKELYNQFLVSNGIRHKIDDISLKIKLFDDNSFFEVSKVKLKAFVINVNLVDFARAVEPHIPKIFDANVRNLLKSPYNKEMEETILDSDKREYFWHYNNGLTVLCNKIEFDKAKKHITLSAPNIVNGCQTTATLAKAIKLQGGSANNIDIPILMKVIEVDFSGESSLVIDIAKYTNAQNALKDPDFKSNEEEQETIAAGFKMLSPSIFYERKRGQWANLTRPEKKAFEKSIKMENVAQRWHAFRFSPSSAITNKKALFAEEGIYKKIFVPPRSAIEYLVAHELFDQYNKLLDKNKKEADAEIQKILLKIDSGEISKEDSSSPLENPNLMLKLSKARNLVSAHMLNMTYRLIIEEFKEFDMEVANKIFPAIASRTLSDSFFIHFQTAFRRVGKTLPKDETWSSTLKLDGAINDLYLELKDHINMYKTMPSVPGIPPFNLWSNIN